MTYGRVTLIPLRKPSPHRAPETALEFADEAALVRCLFLAGVSAWPVMPTVIPGISDTGSDMYRQPGSATLHTALCQNRFMFSRLSLVIIIMRHMPQLSKTPSRPPRLSTLVPQFCCSLLR